MEDELIKRISTVPLFHSLFLTFIPFIFSSTSYADGFEKTYGGVNNDEGRDAVETQDGGYILLGTTASFGAGGDDFYLVKTDSSGNTLWTKTYGGTQNERGRSLQETSDGGFVILGSTRSFGAGLDDFYLVRTNSAGDTLWTKTYGGSENDWARSVSETSDRGFIILGRTRSFGSGSWDFYLVRTDSIGVTLWTKTYGGSGADEGSSALETIDRGYILIGWTSSYGAGLNDFYLVRVDSLGNTLWTKTYGGTNSDLGYSLQKTSDGGFIILGYTISFGAGLADFYLVKTDSLGDTLWTKTFGGSGDDYGRSVGLTSRNEYVLVGYTNSFGSGLNDLYLIGTDSTGGLLWTRTFGDTLDDYGYSGKETSNGMFIIGGSYKSSGAGNDVYLIETPGANHNGGVVTLNVPGDTVYTDSSYAVQASVRNYGNVSETFDVIATIGSYSDTVQVTGLLPDTSIQVNFSNWIVPPQDSILYTMTVCTRVPLDSDTTNDCSSKTIFAYTYRFEDIGVTALTTPPDTVFTDSTYTPEAWIRNYGNLTSNSINVIATIDTYSDTQVVSSLSPGDSTLVTFQNWTVPSPDSTNYLYSVCTNVVGDEDMTNDCDSKSIFAYTPVGVEEEGDFRLPIADFRLFQNFPNPFHHSTLIQYQIPLPPLIKGDQGGFQIPVRLTIYDITGRLVETLINESQEPGIYQIPISSHQLPGSGIYFYRLSTGHFTFTRKLTLLR